MRTIEEIQANKHLSNIIIKSVNPLYVFGNISLLRWKGTFVFSIDEGALEHVSISPSKSGIIPNWYELKETKQIFWRADEEVIQFLPKAAEYVNIKQNCLHLWRPMCRESIDELIRNAMECN